MNPIFCSDDVVWILLALIYITNVGLSLTSSQCHPCECSYSAKIKGYVAFCSSLGDLFSREVPKSLPNHIEYLDLRKNRISELTATSFTRYTELKYLYLSDNNLDTIDDITFVPLTKLLYLDLTNTAITVLPTYLPPSLETLYLGINGRMFKGGKEPVLPELDSLRVLYLDDNHIKTFPKFVRHLRSLEVLNLTQNPDIHEFTSEDLAGLCNLKTLTIDAKDLFTSPSKTCECLKTRKWTETYGITVRTLTCGKEKVECDMTFSNESMNARNSCESSLAEKNFWKKVTIGGGILGVILVIVLLLFLYCCRKKRRGRKREAAVTYRKENIEDDEKPENAYE